MTLVNRSFPDSYLARLATDPLPLKTTRRESKFAMRSLEREKKKNKEGHWRERILYIRRKKETDVKEAGKR